MAEKSIATSAWPAARLVLIGGSLTMALSLGVRHTFGLFLDPVSMANGWGREAFSFAIALQNLVWGFSQPFTGMLSDRIGAGKVVFGGAVLYVAGLVLMSLPQGPGLFAVSAGILIGLGLSGVTFPVILSAISRAVPEEKRSLAMGISMAVGSFGQFAMLPVALAFIDGFQWAGALIAMSVLMALVLPISFLMSERRASREAIILPEAPAETSALQALGDACRSRDFWLLSLGFFVCGFQLIFIAIHLPAFLADEGLPPSVATIVLALIGLFNIVGSYLAGLWGGVYRKPKLLAWLYLGRALSIAAFIFLPVTPWSAYLFGITMGLFWLSTVPLTNGIVATIFGVRNMAMLGGIVFFAHQVGSFLGGWLGGVFYDRFGNYDLIWGVAIGLSVLAALVNLPIRETPFRRVVPA